MKVIWAGQNGGGYPTMSIRRGNFAPIDCIMGFLGAEELQPVLVYYGENFHKEMSFEKFQKQYVEQYKADVIKKVFSK